MSKLEGSVFDRKTPRTVIASRLLGALVLSLCSLMFYAVLFT